MSYFVRLLYLDPQIVKTLNYRSDLILEPQEKGFNVSHRKIGGNMFKNLMEENYNASICEITMQAFSNCKVSKLWKP